MRVVVIGIGAMGKPIAVSCLVAGHSVIVYNRSRARADELRSFGAEVADSVGPTCGCDVVITILADDSAPENVAFASPEFFSSFAANSVHVSASKISVSMAKRLAKAHAERGGQFMAAPIMGRPEMAASRQISLLVAGDPLTYGTGVGCGEKPAAGSFPATVGSFSIAVFAALSSADMNHHTLLKRLRSCRQSARRICMWEFQRGQFSVKSGWFPTSKLFLAVASRSMKSMPMPGPISDSEKVEYSWLLRSRRRH